MMRIIYPLLLLSPSGYLSGNLATARAHYAAAKHQITVNHVLGRCSALIENAISAAADSHGVEERLIRAIVAVESSGNHLAIALLALRERCS